MPLVYSLSCLNSLHAGGGNLTQPTQLRSNNGVLEMTLTVDMENFTVDWLTLKRRIYNG